MTPNQLKASRWHLVERDMREVVALVDAFFDVLEHRESLRPDTPDVAATGLLQAAIVIYSRSFLTSQNSEGKADPKADFDLLPMARDEAAVRLHRSIIDRRHQVVAHADGRHHASQIVPVPAGVIGVLRVNRIPQPLGYITPSQFREHASTLADQAFDISSDLDLSSINSS